MSEPTVSVMPAIVQLCNTTQFFAANENFEYLSSPSPAMEYMLGIAFVLLGASTLALTLFITYEFHAAPRRRKSEAIGEFLTCPISCDIMRDPVTLVQSGHTFDRESLCQWLLIHPTRCPYTNVDYGVKLQYGDNIVIRQLLTLYKGDAAYQQFDDSGFEVRYAALWNESLYENIAAYLYGMNKKQIAWAAIQQTLMNDYQDDAIVVAFKALLLYPGFRKEKNLLKNESEALFEWKRAGELGLLSLIDAGNPWAQWIQGVLLYAVKQDYDSAKSLYKLAADQGHALAQCSLGALYEEDDDYDTAEEYYELAAEQGHALAQYNLALLFEPEFDMMKPHLERAASQGHDEALLCLYNFYVDSDVVEQDFKKVLQYLRLAACNGNPKAQYHFCLLYEDGNGLEIAAKELSATVQYNLK